MMRRGGTTDTLNKLIAELIKSSTDTSEIARIVRIVTSCFTKQSTSRSAVRDIADETSRTVRHLSAASRRYEDNISKKMADIRMSPWRDVEHTDLDTDSRSRLSGLQRELHDLTVNNMSYRQVGG